MAVLIISLPLVLAEEYSLLYDANGNLVYDSETNVYREYNELNQLIRTRVNNVTGTILQEYVWDPIEERIFIKDEFYSNGSLKSSTYYFGDDYVIIQNSSGIFNQTYIYQDGILVGYENVDGRKRYVLPDHEGSVHLVLNESGDVIEENLFSPFAEPLQGVIENKFSYEAKEYDSLTKDYDFHFRKYDPKLRIFTQPDTLIQNVYDPQLLNRYAFERNNPYKYTDPTGHFIVYYGEVGSVGFGTGAQGAFGNVISFSFANGLQYGTYQRYGAGVMSPTASGSVEVGFSPFMKNIEEFKGEFADFGFDVGQVASVGFGVSVPYNEKSKKFKLSNFVISSTGSFTDLNPPITPVSGYAVYSNTLVNYRQSNNLRLTSSVLIQNEYLRYQTYFSDKKESSSRSGRGGGGGGGCRCGPWGNLREEAEKAKSGETAGDIIRRWRERNK